MINPTLVLNADARPLSVIPLTTLSWEDAISVWYKKEADIIEWYHDWKVRSPSTETLLPSVIRLKEYKNIARKIKFSRHNVFLRDDFMCQFCGLDGAHDHTLLTFDHFTPRCKGGKTEWENVITACSKCNLKKGNLTPKEAGLKVNKTPHRPEYFELAAKVQKMKLKVPHETWIPYLGWPEENIILLDKPKRFQ